MKTIVIVENNQKIAEQLVMLIKKVSSKAEILLANNIFDGYRLIRRETVSLLITDIELGWISPNEYPGIRLISQLRKYAMYQYLPIIALTESEMHKEYLYEEMNCVGCFSKTISEDSFLKVVERILSSEEITESNAAFCVRKNNVYYRIPMDEFVYAESFERTLHIHLSSGEVLEVSQKPIQYITRQIKSKELMWCARGLLVNKKYIVGLDRSSKSVILRDGSSLRIGKAYISNVKENCQIMKRKK